MTDTDYQFQILTPEQVDALRSVQKLIGDGNAAKGFHDRTRTLRHLSKVCRNDGRGGKFEGAQWDRLQATHDENLTDHVVATAALIDTETSELIEEVRKGKGLNEVYYSSEEVYVDPSEVLPTDLVLVASSGIEEGKSLVRRSLKPEGVPAELADVEIRGFDFAERFDIDLAIEIDRKLAYNATRAFMHGKKL
ncbi:hypothetical protein MRBLMI12_000435 [Microbacterium sp. LMI12-1-1.1]|uniref:hypothetical protein n=1 Tax=Microbacterium sp. LMI12-1-1.1 TaxID=3135225 RepID=UPI00343DA9A2